MARERKKLLTGAQKPYAKMSNVDKIEDKMLQLEEQLGPREQWTMAATELARNLCRTSVMIDEITHRWEEYDNISLRDFNALQNNLVRLYRELGLSANGNKENMKTKSDPRSPGLELYAPHLAEESA